MSRRSAWVAILIAGGLMVVASPAAAQVVERSGWVPNVGSLSPGELPSGDMWTFRCPAQGSGVVFVDTKDDFDQATSGLDPTAYVVDSQGRLLGVGDDEAPCTARPVCGFACPRFEFGPCDGNPHSLIIRDFGLSGGDRECNTGGGYRVFLQVFDKYGRPYPPDLVKLGGGPSRVLPAWARGALGLPYGADQGPALDDEDVPNVPGDAVAAGGAARAGAAGALRSKGKP